MKHFILPLIASCCIAVAKDKPNIVILLGDDMTWSDCEPYGSTNVPTPNLRKLAEQGMRFNNMYTSTAMCSPARQMLFTGLFPVRNGAFPNHSEVRPGVKTIVQHLSTLGYTVSLEGKKHFGPMESFAFAKRGLERVLERKDRPFCHIIASHEPHKPWTEGDASAFDPGKIIVPPNLIDTPETRQQLCQYYAEISILDQTLGSIIQQLDSAGVTDNTILLFNSEQGMPLPFGGKWTCYESGLKTAFIVRWPGIVKPGSSTSALTQSVDILPTLIEIAGGDPTTMDTGCTAVNGSRGFDGKSLLAILKGESAHLRDHIFGVQTTQGIINGSLYPIRSVRDSRYKLIRNLNHGNTFQNLYTEGGEFYEEFYLPLLAAAQKSPAIMARLDFFQHRPAEEFYDLSQDPHELRDLSASPEHNAARLRLGQKLDEWMREQADLGIETEKTVNITKKF
jgi:N-sulfoglucosamine sulfohydrolase